MYKNILNSLPNGSNWRQPHCISMMMQMNYCGIITRKSAIQQQKNEHWYPTYQNWRSKEGSEAGCDHMVPRARPRHSRKRNEAFQHVGRCHLGKSMTRIFSTVDSDPLIIWLWNWPGQVCREQSSHCLLFTRGAAVSSFLWQIKLWQCWKCVHNEKIVLENTQIYLPLPSSSSNPGLSLGSYMSGDALLNCVPSS